MLMSAVVANVEVVCGGSGAAGPNLPYASQSTGKYKQTNKGLNERTTDNIHTTCKQQQQQNINQQTNIKQHTPTIIQ